jgi:hypothetical protein
MILSFRLTKAASCRMNEESMEPAEGFEPPTSRLRNACTSIVLRRHSSHSPGFACSYAGHASPPHSVAAPRVAEGEAWMQID